MTSIVDSVLPVASVLEVAFDNGSLGGADWSNRAVVLEALPEPLVAGYPAEGAYVQISDGSGGIAASGWFSVDGRNATETHASVAVVWREPLMAVEHTYKSWTGLVRPRDISPVTVSPGAAPAWFGEYVRPIHERAAVERTLQAVRESANTERANHREWVRRLNESACEWADENSLCSEFERFCEQWGLEGRERDFDVEVNVTVALTMTRSARSQEDADESVDLDDVRQHLRDNFSYLDVNFTVGE